jgi:hypothetical protein
MLPTLGRTFQPVRLKNLAAEEKSTDFNKCLLRKRAKIFISGQIVWPIWLDYLEKNWHHRQEGK